MVFGGLGEEAGILYDSGFWQRIIIDVGLRGHAATVLIQKTEVMPGLFVCYSCLLTRNAMFF